MTPHSSPSPLRATSGLLLALVAAALIGCSGQKNISPMPSITEDQRQAMEKPVNCKTARQDIEILENEKASVARQLLAGARSVMPIAAVAGILTGDYNDRASVAIGTYNEDIEKKIRQIRAKCRI